MKFKSLILFFSVLVASCSSVTEMEHVHTMTSPDGRLEMTLYMDGQGTPFYALEYQERNVILPSSLGFDLSCGSFRDGFEVQSVDTLTFDEVTSEDVLQMTMASGGGFAISFEEKR